MVFGQKIASATYDILRGVNATIWGGMEEADKVGKIVKTGLSGADAVIGASHAIEDFGCNDYVCASLDVIGSVSSTVGLILGNIPSTKPLTQISGSVTPPFAPRCSITPLQIGLRPIPGLSLPLANSSSR